MMSSQFTMVIPVYNEGASFPSLWAAVCSQIRSDFSALVVYDFDEDNTVPVVQQIIAQGERRLRLLKNAARRGVVGAILAGFNAVASGPVLVVMADLSDDLGQVDRMLGLYQQGYDVVVGSRYMPGGKIINGPFLKQGLSRLAGLTLHWFRGMPTHDATNAFKIYDREMLKSLTIESQAGFELNLELTVKAFLAGYRITEIPATWRERSAGKSRFRLWAWLPKYLRWYFYAFRPGKGLKPLVRREKDHIVVPNA
jgi:glycosyltransferase involved in cell wall biosynthesis